MTRPPAVPWWRRYFDQDFLDLLEPLFPEAESRREVSVMLELLGLPLGNRILDAPCGWGRHTLLFAEAGLDAFGADLSVPLLARAVADARGSAVRPARFAPAPPARFAAADLRALPFADASFDAVVNVFTSLGLFLRDEDDVLALTEARRVLRPGGALLLESMHRDDVACTFAERDRWVLPDGTEVRVRRRFDPVTGISREIMRWRRGESRGEKRHAIRIRTATEIDRLLAAANFDDRHYFGDWTGEPLRHDSPRIVLVARV